ncbi:MAG: HAD family phosphatase [Ardenticatenaceae bacterium]|nr:HAD family phosphatase [Ardenticatenaceae bacterium]
MKFKAIVFDFNGVLWWDGHLQEAAWQIFAEQLRGRPFTSEEMAVQVHGRTNRHTLEYLTGQILTDRQTHQLSEQKETIYRQTCLDLGDRFQLSPGAVDLLNFLVEHQISHTIATASGKSNVDFFVEYLNLSHWFDLDRIIYDNGTRRGKPAPDCYRDAARILETIPEKCIVVEDSRSGMAAARAAGIGHIIALGPTPAHKHLAQVDGVAQVVTDLSQISRSLFG